MSEQIKSFSCCESFCFVAVIWGNETNNYNREGKENSLNGVNYAEREPMDSLNEYCYSNSPSKII